MRGVEQIPWLYDLLLAAIEGLGLGRLRRRLMAGARGLTLDVGCGTGRNLPLVPAGARAIGLDPDAAALRVARRRAPAVPLVRARAEALPFRDGAFATVTSGLVLCSVEDPARALAELHRVTSDGGTLRLLEHVRADGGWLARFQDWIQPLWTRVMGGCHPNRRTEASVARAGFVSTGEEPDRGAVLRRFSVRKPSARP